MPFFLLGYSGGNCPELGIGLQLPFLALIKGGCELLEQCFESAFFSQAVVLGFADCKLCGPPELAAMLAYFLGALLLGGHTSATSLYSEYILAPDSRTVLPATIYKVNGTVSNAQSLVKATNGSAIFNGNSSITFDYEKNVAGVVSVTVGSVSDADAIISVTFTESNLWINGLASDATADAGLDTPLYLEVGAGPGTYTVAREFERGAFRYLSLFSNSSSVEVQGVSINFTAAPGSDLQSYPGYFHSNDDLVNRIWYAGRFQHQTYPSTHPYA